MVVCKIVRAIDKDKEVASQSVLEIMFMLKKSWDEKSEKSIQNCFRTGGVSAQSKESAMYENDDSFKGILCNDDDPIGDLEFDFNQLRQVNPELNFVNLDANDLVDIDADIASNNSQPLTVEEIVNDLNNEPHVESDDANHQNEGNATTITSSTRNELDDATETLSKLILFTDDLDFDPLLSKLSEKITQNRLQTMRQSSVYNYFK